MINELLLLSNNDIPLPEARLVIHVPTLKEIALIGEKSFNIGCQFLNFSKESLSDEDKSRLVDKTDFEVFMSVMNSTDKIQYKTDTMMVLTLLFPDYYFSLKADKIVFKKDDFTTELNKENYPFFKDIICDIFCLKKVLSSEGVYSPADKQAAKIAEKFKKRHEKLNKLKNGQSEEGEQKVSIFVRYVSILSVGLQKDINLLMDYNVYQLLDEFTRFQKKQEFDAYIQAKMAGAKDLEDVDNWMNDIHP